MSADVTFFEDTPFLTRLSPLNMYLNVVNGGKPKIRHKNMMDGVAANGGPNIYIYIYYNKTIYI